jgi:hypothetical protein
MKFNYPAQWIPLFYLLLSSLFMNLHAQTISGVKTIGNGGDFTSLTRQDGLFNAINTSTVTGNLTIQIISDISTEDGTVALNQWAESGAGNYTITIQSSDAELKAISGSYSGGANADNGLIRMNGADRVVFHGGNGTDKKLLFRNNASGNWAAVLHLLNDATNNDIHNCIFEGGINSPSQTFSQTNGIIYLGGTSGNTGNDNNAFSNCDLGHNSTNSNRPVHGFFAEGNATFPNDNITISGCNIYNFTGAATAGNNPTGIKVTGTGNGNNWNISGNSFYYTSSFAQGSFSGTPIAIDFSPGNSSNNTIRGNFMGGDKSALPANAISGTWILPDLLPSTFNGIRVNTGIGTNTLVSNNKIGNISGARTFYGINIIGGSVHVNNNTIDNAGTLLTGSFRGISVSGTTMGTVNLTSNRIVNITLPASATLHGFYGIYYADGTGNVGGLLPADGNLVDNIVNLSASNDNTSQTTEGIYNSSFTPVLISYNTVSNVNVNAGNINGIRNNVWSSGGPGTVANNKVFNLRSSAVTPLATSDFGRNTVITGIYLLGFTPGVSGNTVYNLSSSAASASVAVTGIFYYPILAGYVLENNFVHSISLATSSTTGRITGIAIGTPAGTFIPGTIKSATIQNNMVRLGIDSSGNAVSNAVNIYGIQKANTVSQKIYHNTVYIGGSVAGSGGANTFAFRRTNAASDDIRNNIFVNERSNTGSGGSHFAVVFESNAGLTSNFNLYNASGTGGILGSYDGGTTPANNLTELIAASGGSQELNAVVGDPLFINATGNSSAVDLHINSPLADATGVLLAPPLTFDFDGDLRAAFTPADIGADAFNPSAMPPTIVFAENPAIAVGVCASEAAQTTSLFYTSTTQDPTLYSIVWDTPAISENFTNVNLENLPESPISIDIPEGAAPGTYTGSLTVRNANLTSISYGIRVTVHPVPVIRITNPLPECFPLTVDLGLVWSEINDLQGSATYHDNISDAEEGINPVSQEADTSGTYYIRFTSTAGGCVSVKPVLVVIDDCTITFNQEQPDQHSDGIELYPNPAREYFIVQTQYPFSETSGYLEIRDAAGRIVYREYGELTNLASGKTIHFPALESGIYQLSLGNSSVRLLKSFIIAR